MRSDEITLNGEPFALPDDRSVERLIESATGSAAGRGVAVAIDGEVVPRSEWSAKTVQPGQKVELLVATQGG